MKNLYVIILGFFFNSKSTMNININKLIISYDDINATININVCKLIIGYINKIHDMKLLRLPMQIKFIFSCKKNVRRN